MLHELRGYRDVYDADRAISKADSSVADTFLEASPRSASRPSACMPCRRRAGSRGRPNAPASAVIRRNPTQASPSSDGATTRTGSARSPTSCSRRESHSAGWSPRAWRSCCSSADVARRIFSWTSTLTARRRQARQRMRPLDAASRRRSRAAVSSEAGAPPLDAGRGAGATPRGVRRTSARATDRGRDHQRRRALGDDGAHGTRGLLEALVYETDADVVLTATENPIGLLLRSPKKLPRPARPTTRNRRPRSRVAAAADDQVTPWLLLLGRFESCPAETLPAGERRSRTRNSALAPVAAAIAGRTPGLGAARERELPQSQQRRRRSRTGRRRSAPTRARVRVRRSHLRDFRSPRGAAGDHPAVGARRRRRWMGGRQNPPLRRACGRGNLHLPDPTRPLQYGRAHLGRRRRRRSHADEARLDVWRREARIALSQRARRAQGPVRPGIARATSRISAGGTICRVRAHEPAEPDGLALRQLRS